MCVIQYSYYTTIVLWDCLALACYCIMYEGFIYDSLSRIYFVLDINIDHILSGVRLVHYTKKKAR